MEKVSHSFGITIIGMTTSGWPPRDDHQNLKLLSSNLRGHNWVHFAHRPEYTAGADPGYVKRGGRDPKGGGGAVADITPK